MVLIDAKTRIRRLDDQCIAVEERKRIKDKKNGKTKYVWEIFGYYGRLNDALVGILHRRSDLMLDKKMDIKSLSKSIQDAEKQLLEMGKISKI